MSINKSKLIKEGDCPFCGASFIYDDEDRLKGENTCDECKKTYKIDQSKNIVTSEALKEIKTSNVRNIAEGDCPFCGTRFKYDDNDRLIGENKCTNCGKTYNLENSNNISLLNTPNNETISTPVNVPKKKNGKIPSCIGFIIIIIFSATLLGCLMSLANPSKGPTYSQTTQAPVATSTPTPTKTPEEIAKLKAEADAKAEADRLAEVERQKQEAIRLANEEKTFKANSPSIPYAQLEKNSTPYYGNKVYYKGKVEQVGTEYSTEWYRISITDLGYGYYSDTLWVTYPGTTTIVKDDIVQFWGNITSDHCYTSTANWEICIPSVNAKYINK